MSAGPFTTAFYETNSGEICRVKVQPETLSLALGSPAVANDSATGPSTQLARAIASGSRAGIGVNCRRVRLQWVGGAPTGYDDNGIITVPILQPGLWNSLESDVTEGTYLGQSVRVKGVTPEFIN